MIRFSPALVAAAGILLTAACDRQTMTEPFAVPSASPMFSVTNANLPIPATNTGGGAVSSVTIGQLPVKKWGLIRVSGYVQLTKNPELTACDSTINPAAAGMRAGPLGLPTAPTLLRVSVFRGSSPLPLILDGDSSEVKVNLPIYNAFPTAEDITASRTGISGEKYPCPGPNGTPVSVGYYQMSGSQNVSLEVLPDPEVNPVKTLVSSGQSVTFLAEDSPPGILPGWWFVAGDTAGTPNGYFGSNSLIACPNTATCTIPVTASGRMYLRLGNGLGGLVYYPSPVVWVGKTPAENLSVVCIPGWVNMNATTRCTAKSSGPSVPTVKKWFYVSTTNATTELPACGTAQTCEVQVPGPGAVYARALLSAVEQTASDNVVVVTGCPTGDSISWTGCNTLAPAEVDSIHASVDRQYLPAKDADCQNIYDKLHNYLEHNPFYKFAADTLRDNPALNRYEFGAHWPSTSPGGWIVGLRDFLFGHPTILPPADQLGRTAFHEAAHAAGYPDAPDGVDPPPPGTAQHYEAYCKI